MWHRCLSRLHGLNTNISETPEITMMRPARGALDVYRLRANSMRSHYCGDINADHIDQTVELCGWANRRRQVSGTQYVPQSNCGWR